MTTTETVLLTISASLLSGVLGVIISSFFYASLERKKLKRDTARKMFGSKHDISGDKFLESMNEVLFVFSDSQSVIDVVQHLFGVIETPKEARPSKAADEALIRLMKAMCKDIGIKYKELPDSYYLKFFGVPKENA
jgi:hypothetical protein